MDNELSTLKNAVYHPDECLTPQNISGNSIAYSWLYIASLILVTSLKNGDKNTARPFPAPTCSHSALQWQRHKFTRATDFPEYAEPIFAHGEAKAPAALCATPERRNPQRLALV